MAWLCTAGRILVRNKLIQQCNPWDLLLLACDWMWSQSDKHTCREISRSFQKHAKLINAATMTEFNLLRKHFCHFWCIFVLIVWSFQEFGLPRQGPSASLKFCCLGKVLREFRNTGCTYFQVNFDSYNWNVNSKVLLFRRCDPSLRLHLNNWPSVFALDLKSPIIYKIIINFI